MPNKPLFDCEILFPRIAAIIRKADGYIDYYDIVENLMNDPVFRELEPDPKIAPIKAQKVVGAFSKQYTMKRLRFGMEMYRREFVRKRDGLIWAYKAKGGYTPRAEYAPLLPVVEEIRQLLTELAHTEDDRERIRLRKEVKSRGFRISVARDYLRSKES